MGPFDRSGRLAAVGYVIALALVLIAVYLVAGRGAEEAHWRDSAPTPVLQTASLRSPGEPHGRLAADLVGAIDNLELGRVNELFELGADPNGSDASGMPHLHHAIDIERDTAAQSDTALTADITEALLLAGADPTVEWNGESALEFATSLGHSLAATAIRRRQA